MNAFDLAVGGWRRVVFAAECDAFGNCPVCGDVDFAECPCPGPTQDDEVEYREIDGVMFGRRFADVPAILEARIAALEEKVQRLLLERRR